jgi:hypothetical protein
LVAVAIAVACGNAFTSALINRAGAVANAACIHGAHAIVFVVTDAIHVGVGGTIATTLTDGVLLVAVAVAIAEGHVRTSALVDRTRTVANAARINHANAVVHVVTNAIGVDVGKAVSTALSNGVFLVAIAIAVTCGNVFTTALVDLTWTVAHATGVQCAHAVVHIVTNAVGIDIGSTVPTTFTQHIFLVAIAVAVACRDVFTSAFVDLSWAVANAARVKRTHAVVHVVANAVGIGVFSTVAPTDTNGVELVSVTVAIASRNVRTATLVNRARTVADATLVERTHAVVHVVTNAVGIDVGGAVTAAYAQGVELVAVAIAVASRDVRTSTLVNLSWTVAHATRVKRSHTVVHIVTNAIGIDVGSAVTTTHAEGVELVSVTIAIAFRDVRTSALVDLSWAVADAARVERAHAVVHIVTNAIGIHVGGTVTTAYAQGVELVAVAVTVPGRNVLTSAFVNGAGAIANAASIKGAYAIVHIVTNPVGIGVFRTVTTTHAKGVELVAVAVAIASRNVPTSAFVNGTWTIANPALVECAHTIVFVVTNPIGIGVGSAVASTNAKHILHIAIAVASALGDAFTTTVATLVQFEAASIIFRGICIVVAGRGVSATRNCACVEDNDVSELLQGISLREYLSVDLPRKRSGCRDLHHQDLQILSGERKVRCWISIGTGKGKPCSPC